MSSVDETGQDRWWVAWEQWVNIVQPTVTLREAFQAGFSASGNSDLEAADAWCRERGARVRYLTPDQGEVVVEVEAFGGYRGLGRTLPEAAEDAQVRRKQIASERERE